MSMLGVIGFHKSFVQSHEDFTRVRRLEVVGLRALGFRVYQLSHLSQEHPKTSRKHSHLVAPRTSGKRSLLS